jgi:flagellar hook-associated protein 3 FlgL
MLNTVSTSSLFACPRNAVSTLQTKLVQAETEQTTGLLADPVQSLGSQIGLSESLQSQAASLANMQSSNTIADTTLSVSQNALTSIASDAQTFINSLVSAQGSGEVGTLPAQAKSLLDSFTSYMNTASAGAFVFGGTNSSVAPMANYSGPALSPTAQTPQAATGNAFNAELTALGNVQPGDITSTQMQSFLSGGFANLFADPAWTTNWSQASSTGTSAVISPGQSVPTTVTANNNAFRELASAYTSIADLGLTNFTSSTQQAVLTSALKQVSAAAQGITDMQTTLGFSQSQVTKANSALQTQASTVNNTLNQLEGVDPYEAATKLTELTTQLETAYSLTNRISKLGLVNYLAT